ncbi:MAG: YceI family protein [Sphingomonadales bacterium]|nr:YceI family protein [Sphingomonadales bacterium]
MTAAVITPERYARSAIVLHWLLALLLGFQLALGWRLEGIAKGLGQFQAYQLHKSIGIAILLLSLVRLGVRLVKPRPPEAEGPAALRWLARVTHWALYGVMIGGPLTGWAVVSTAKVKLQTMLFGVVPWPSLPLGQGWHDPAAGLHSLLGPLLAGLVLLHVGGALKHHLAGDGILARMMPASVQGRSALTLRAALALAGLGGAMALAALWPFGNAATPPTAQQSAAPVVPSAVLPTSEPSETPSAAASEAASDTASAAPSEAAHEAAAAWAVEPGGRLGFRADYSGSAVEGSFHKWNADIVFSADDLEHSRIRVAVDLASADTADATRDEMLRSDSFFDVAAHPKAVFTANSIHQHGHGYVANGTLSLHGHDRPLALPFTLTIDGNRATASGSARLNRTDFGVGGGEWASTDQIGDGVSISFSLKAKRR